MSGAFQGVAPLMPSEVKVATGIGTGFGARCKYKYSARAVLPVRAQNKYGSCSRLTGAAKLLWNTSLHRTPSSCTPQNEMACAVTGEPASALRQSTHPKLLAVSLQTGRSRKELTTRTRMPGGFPAHLISVSPRSCSCVNTSSRVTSDMHCALGPPSSRRCTELAIIHNRVTGWNARQLHSVGLDTTRHRPYTGDCRTK